MVKMRPPSLNGAGEAGHVTKRMELRLVRKEQAAPRLQRRPRGPIHQGGVYSNALCRDQLALQDFLVIVRREEQVAVESLEVTIELLTGDNRLDPG
jgi:hypothetical protein